MGTPKPSWASAATIFRELVAPVVLFVLACVFLVYDGIVDPPTELQGLSGLAIVLIAISTGMGMDVVKARRNGGGA